MLSSRKQAFPRSGLRSLSQAIAAKLKLVYKVKLSREEAGGLSRADFREGDEVSNFSVFRVRRFTESPGPLH